MSDLGLNVHHTEVVSNYLSFTKLQRVTNLRTIDGLFQDVFDSRLLDTSYTVDEVQDILYSLRKLVKGELESGLMDLNHMNVLMLQQLFSQAENWHLRLEVNLSELQNRSLLEKVRDIDQNGFAPLQDRAKKVDDPNDPISLLQIEIKRLKRDIANNEDEISSLKEKLEVATEENNSLNEKFKASLLSDGKEKLKIVELEEKISKLQNELKDALNKNSENTTSNRPDSSRILEIQALEEKVRQTQSRLKLAEQELDRKFKDTAAYMNMKKLLESKNDQMKKLRERLKKFDEDQDKSESDE